MTILDEIRCIVNDNNLHRIKINKLTDTIIRLTIGTFIMDVISLDYNGTLLGTINSKVWKCNIESIPNPISTEVNYTYLVLGGNAISKLKIDTKNVRCAKRNKMYTELTFIICKAYLRYCITAEDKQEEHIKKIKKDIIKSLEDKKFEEIEEASSIRQNFNFLGVQLGIQTISSIIIVLAMFKGWFITLACIALVLSLLTGIAFSIGSKNELIFSITICLAVMVLSLGFLFNRQGFYEIFNTMKLFVNL